MKRKYTLFIIYLLIALGLNAQPSRLPKTFFEEDYAPKSEVRAVWIATIGGIDWPHSYAQNTPRSIEKQKAELCDILDKLRDAGMNTVLLQTRVRGTTIYPSRLEPWDGCLSGKPGTSPGYDALAFAIDECHKRGMELHAWVVTIPVGKWNALGCQQLRKRYPNLVKKIGSDGYLNPEDSKTADVVADLCDEIVRNYDVDGIHLDYIRYPEEWKIKVSKQVGRRYITNIAKKVSNVVKSRKPWVKMSCAPIGKYDDLPRQRSNGWNANSRVCQDAQGWLRDGIMDMLFPMMYFKGNNFYPFAIDWQENSYGRLVVPGLGLYFMSPKEKNWSLTTITQEMEVLRQWGMGNCMFRSKFFTDDTKGIYDFTRKQFNTTQALVPAMTWTDKKAPASPVHLEIDSIASELKWDEVKDESGCPYTLYNVYYSKEWPVDINDSRNLVRARLTETSLKVPLTGGYYAVAAMNRYGFESASTQLKQPYNYVLSPLKNSFSNAKEYLKVEKDTLFLPNGLNKKDLISIETLQGNSIYCTFFADRIDVSSIPEGMYQVRSISKKKYTHKLGCFIIKPRHKIDK